VIIAQSNKHIAKTIPVISAGINCKIAKHEFFKYQKQIIETGKPLKRKKSRYFFNCSDGAKISGNYLPCNQPMISY